MVQFIWFSSGIALSGMDMKAYLVLHTRCNPWSTVRGKFCWSGYISFEYSSWNSTSSPAGSWIQTGNCVVGQTAFLYFFLYSSFQPLFILKAKYSELFYDSNNKVGVVSCAVARIVTLRVKAIIVTQPSFLLLLPSSSGFHSFLVKL